MTRLQAGRLTARGSVLAAHLIARHGRGAGFISAGPVWLVVGLPRWAERADVDDYHLPVPLSRLFRRRGVPLPDGE